MGLTQKWRPETFKDMLGAEVPRKVMQAVAREPDDKCHSYVLAGGRGCGKTSTARIFGKAVNHSKRLGDNDPKDSNCRLVTEGSEYYLELDTAVTGNVEEMRNIRQQVAYSISKGYRTIVLDEIHLASPAAQSSLLKVLEDVTGRVFFLFCTTNAEKILDTIISRSVYLEFPPLSQPDSITLLTKITKAEEITLTESTMKYVHRRVGGHARDLVQQLETVKILGEAGYLENIKLLDEEFERLINLFREDDPDSIKVQLDLITSYPVAYIEQDFEVFIRRLADRIFLTGEEKDRKLKELVGYYLKNHRFLVTTNDWYVFMTSLNGLFTEKKKKSSSSDQGSNRFIKQ